MKIRASLALSCLLVMTGTLLWAGSAVTTQETIILKDQNDARAPSKSVPAQLNYQGYLADAADSSAITATVEMTFRLFDSETKGAELWSETHPAVEVHGGLFQVLLGSVMAFPEGLFDGSPLWLQTEVGTEILSPRKPLVSVAYSRTAAETAR